MSRVIVRNLPRKLSSDKLRADFSIIGHVTDAKIMHTKYGHSRQFGYIGYAEEDCGKLAVERFNNTYIEGMKIDVSIAKSFIDPELPRPWSKYSRGSSAFEINYPQLNKKDKTISDNKTKLKIKEKNEENKIKHTKSNDLDEFLAIFNAKDSQTINNNENSESNNVVSDMQYMKSKISNKPELQEAPINVYTLKMRGLPFKVTEEDIRQFFTPLTLGPNTVRFVLDSDSRPSGRAFVDFNSQKEMYKALRRNGDYLNDRYIELFQDDTTHKTPTNTVTNREAFELLGEHGRLFIRNLPFTVTESDIETLFSPYGPISEIHLPTDPTTQNSVGYGYLTFMFSEHAYKALTELDASIIQGRILHVLPAEPRKTNNNNSENDLFDEDVSYKAKKKKNMKQTATSSNNWNSLFLGGNAVADAVASRYKTSKSNLLDAGVSASLGVRLALGETEIVNETKQFLLENGIDLTCFGAANIIIHRSKNIILAKNLPYGTKANEIEDLFTPFGTLGRVVMPLHWITCIVEFLSHSQAKVAFLKLAYTKFKHMPLYLEWAPESIFTKSAKIPPQESTNVETADSFTVFVKNLNFSTDERSLEKALKKYNPVQVVVSRKKNLKNPNEMQSMGFAFVKFASHESAKKFTIEKQGFTLDGHELNLSLAKQNTIAGGKTNAKLMQFTEKPHEEVENSICTLLVKNIAFQASKRELLEIFNKFGNVKSLRMPKKSIIHSATEHRGFAFLEYFSREDAEYAYENLKSSTHLYGRRLVVDFADDESDVNQLRKRTKNQYVADSSTDTFAKKTKF